MVINGEKDDEQYIILRMVYFSRNAGHILNPKINNPYSKAMISGKIKRTNCIKLICFISLMLLLDCKDCFAQLFSETGDIIHDTKYYRRGQTVDSIITVQQDAGNVIINFIATLNKKQKKQPFHIILPLDSLLSYYKHQAEFKYEFDSSYAATHHVLGLGRRYTNNSKLSRAYGVDVFCFKEILIPGFYHATTAVASPDTVEIVDQSDEEVFGLRDRRHYLFGKHIVFRYYFTHPRNISDESIDYVVINIENGKKVRSVRYLKLPIAFTSDLILSPFVLMMMAVGGH